MRETNALCASIDRSRQASRLPRQVETDIETEQVSKHGPSDAADRALRDAGKDGVAEFGKEAGADPGETVCDGDEVVAFRQRGTSLSCQGKGEEVTHSRR